MIQNIYLSYLILTFPTLLYILLIKFKNKFKKNEEDASFEICIFIMYLTFTIYNKNINYIYTITIILNILYSFSKKNIYILYSILIFVFFYNKISVLYSLVYLITILIIMYILNKTSINKKYFNILSSCLILVLILLTSNKSILSIINYLIVLILTTLTINNVNNLLDTYKELNDLKKENDFKLIISKISHEIKNPLAIIKGYIDIDKKFIYKENVLKEINYALDIINDFKDINHLTINKEYFLFNDVINNIYAFINIIKDKNVKLNIECKKNINIYADKKRLKQVLINIIKNAIEASNKDLTINIKAYKYNKRLIIKIKDNGIGMDKETIDNLFIPFKTKKEYGTGLGLCISKEIIDKHNGTITYISKKNYYTEVLITIPINNKDNKNSTVHKPQADKYKDMEYIHCK